MKLVLHILAFSTAAVCSVGCSKSSSSGNFVSGSVSYKGTPVTGGTILLHAGEKVFPASLGPDGNYTCAGVPAGDYTVTIDNKHLKNVGDPRDIMKKMGGGGPDKMPKDLAKVQEMSKGNAPKYVPIPEKYASAKTSSLTVKVESGKNTRDLTLTD